MSQGRPSGGGLLPTLHRTARTSLVAAVAALVLVVAAPAALAAEVAVGEPTPVERVSVAMTVGSTTATVNGVIDTMPTAPVQSGGGLLVPLRFVVESLIGSVTWDPSSDTATVTGQAATLDVAVGAPKATLTTSSGTRSIPVDPPAMLVAANPPLHRSPTPPVDVTLAPPSVLAKVLEARFHWSQARSAIELSVPLTFAQARAKALLGSLPTYPRSTPAAAAVPPLDGCLTTGWPPLPDYPEATVAQYGPVERVDAPMSDVVTWFGHRLHRMGYTDLCHSSKVGQVPGVYAPLRLDQYGTTSIAEWRWPVVEVAVQWVNTTTTRWQYTAVFPAQPPRPRAELVPAGAASVAVQPGSAGAGSAPAPRVTIDAPSAIAALRRAVNALSPPYPYTRPDQVGHGGSCALNASPMTVTFKYTGPTTRPVRLADGMYCSGASHVTFFRPGSPVQYPPLLILSGGSLQDLLAPLLPSAGSGGGGG